MSDIEIIDGEIFKDERGQISSLNNFCFEEVKRCYFIHHPHTHVVRGWHGHQHEKKWFFCLKGSFTLGLVQIDNWENPSLELIPQLFDLNDQQSKIVCVPKGYANCIKANCPDSIMLVYSGKILSEAINDSWRYDKDLWIDWDTIEHR